MIKYFNPIAITVALLALAGIVWWLPNALTGRVPLFDAERRHDPDYIIENFTAVAMAPDGWRKHELRAVRMTHYPDNDTSELDKPYLVQYAPDAPPVHTRADHGTTHADGKTILMRGNVHVYRGTSGKDPGGEAVSQEMLVILE